MGLSAPITSFSPITLPVVVDTTLTWIGKLRTGCNLVGYEEPTWSTGYDRTGSNPHTQGIFTYLGSKNVKVIRNFICWERMQPTAMGALDATYLAAVKLDVDRELAQGIYVSICPWGYNPAVSDTDITYYGAAITAANFADFWGKMAVAFSYDSRISFGLINEPHTNAEGFGSGKVGISLSNWFTAAQAAINAIRGSGSGNYISVPGMGYASAGNWVANGSAAAFLTLTDTFSPRRLIAELHNYGDDFTTSAGHNIDTYMQAAVTHARTNNYKLFVAELATSNNPADTPTITSTTTTKWTNFTNFINTNNDVFCAWCWFGTDDNTVAGWGLDFFHWSLVNPGTNNVGSIWMGLIQNSLGEFTIGEAPPSSPSYPSAPITPQTNTVSSPPLTAADGTQYWTFIPSSYDSSHQTPTKLMVFLHGCGGQSAGDIYLISNFSGQSWISMTPGGAENQCWFDAGNYATQSDKILACIASIRTHYNIDPHQIFLGGYSSGGDIGYPMLFQNSSLFAGGLFNNTSPRGDGSGVNGMTAAAAATNKMHIFHLCHTSDNTDGGNYSPTTVRSDMAILSGEGFTTTVLEKPGTHYVNVSPQDQYTTPGATEYDYRTFVMPHINDGWTAP